MAHKHCPYCDMDIEYLNVVRERAIEFNGDTWEVDNKAISVFQCPDCGDELDSTDLGILGIEVGKIKEAIK